LVLTAYPGSDNAFTRRIDLRRRYPDRYAGRRSWAKRPPDVRLDRDTGLIVVGCGDRDGDSVRIDPTKVLFRNGGKRDEGKAEG
jgi:hypothetical protein